MKKHLFFVFCICSTLICRAQQEGTDTGNYIIENDKKVITNEMIFYYPFQFKKNKKPMYLINGQEVYTISEYHDHEDFKKITVLQPKEGLAKFGKKGRNGVIMVELNDDVKGPEIEITTNRIHYLCNVRNRIADTTIEYYNKVKGDECNMLDLRETTSQHIVYIGFDNEIHMKHLGVGWDMIAISISGATISGTSGNRVIRVEREGPVRLVINTNGKQKEFKLRAVALPAPKLN